MDRGQGLKSERRSALKAAMNSPEYRANVQHAKFLLELAKDAKKKGIKQTDLATKMNLTRSRVSAMLSGANQCNLVTLSKLAEAVGGRLELAYRPSTVNDGTRRQRTILEITPAIRAKLTRRPRGHAREAAISNFARAAKGHSHQD